MGIATTAWVRWLGARGAGLVSLCILVIALVCTGAAMRTQAAGVDARPVLAAGIATGAAMQVPGAAGDGEAFLRLTSGHTQLRPLPSAGGEGGDQPGDGEDTFERLPRTPVTE